MEPPRRHGIAARAAASLGRVSTRSAAAVLIATSLVGTASAQVNRPPTPVPAPDREPPKPLPERPKPVDQAALLAKDPPVPAGRMFGLDALPALAWVEPVNGEGGGNATMLRDEKTGAIIVITTIDALGFSTGVRKVRVSMTAGRAAAGRPSPLESVEASAYDFQALPPEDGLGRLCVLRLATERAYFIPDEGALVFGCAERMRNPWRPEGAKVWTLAIVKREDGALERRRSDVDGNGGDPTPGPGAPVFAAVSAADGAYLPLLVGVEAGDGIRSWPDLRRLAYDEGKKLRPIDDVRALREFVRPEGTWGNPRGLASAIDWATSNSFPRLAHWKVSAAPADGLEFVWRPWAIEGSGEAPRMLSAISELPDDDLALELRNESSAGADLHPAPDAAVAVRSARGAAEAPLTARITFAGPAPEGQARRRILVIEAAGDAQRAMGSLKDAKPAR